MAYALADHRQLIANNPKMKVNNLADIKICTTSSLMPLLEVFQQMNAYDGACPDAVAGIEELKTYFRAIVPDYNDKKVFPSDIRKMICWFNELKGRVDFSN